MMELAVDLGKTNSIGKSKMIPSTYGLFFNCPLLNLLFPIELSRILNGGGGGTKFVFSICSNLKILRRIVPRIDDGK